MLINGLIFRKGKVRCFDFIFDPTKFVPLLFVGVLGVDIWHMLTSSGMELSGGKDIYSFLNSARLNGQSRDYEFLFMNFR